MTKEAIPSFLFQICPSDGDSGQADEPKLPDGATAAGDLARQWATWVDRDFEAACTVLIGAGVANGVEAEGWQGIRDALHPRAPVRPAVDRIPAGERNLLLHAALVGLARAASREAFAYAEQRKANGKMLIQLELLAARLSDLASYELVAELQFGRMCEAADGLADMADRRSAQGEIRRAALMTAIEGAQVWGGHGFLQCEKPGRRVEAAEAILAILDPNEGLPSAGL